MANVSDLVSPKQVARAMGVSESSLKRWCDSGLINVVRTVGGHRKIAISEVVRFARDHDHPVVSPDVVGLPPVSPNAEIGIQRGANHLAEALLEGDEEQARQIVFDLYLAKHSLTVIFDEVIARAFQEIGHRWECRTADVYQERRGCMIAARILYEVRRLQKRPTSGNVAIGGTIDGDMYTLANMMAEITLREVGWDALSLGNSIPWDSLVHSVHELRPRMFWLTVSYIANVSHFVAEFAKLANACREVKAALVVGGRVFHSDLRRQLNYSAFCDTMQQLESLAATLLRPSHGQKKRSCGAGKTNSRRGTRRTRK